MRRRKGSSIRIHGRNHFGTDKVTGQPYSKQRWGSHPAKERKPTASLSEANYIKAAQKALDKGALAAADPALSEANCPFTDDRKAYWLDGFRKGRHCHA